MFNHCKTSADLRLTAAQNDNGEIAECNDEQVTKPDDGVSALYLSSYSQAGSKLCLGFIAFENGILFCFGSF